MKPRIKDERIVQIKNLAAGQSFYLWMVLLLADILYKLFYKHQSFSQIWDIGLIYLAGTFWNMVVLSANGVFSENMKVRIKRVAPLVVLVSAVVAFVAYREGLVKFLPDFVSGMVVGLAFVFTVAYVFSLWWKKRNGLD